MNWINYVTELGKAKNIDLINYDTQWIMQLLANIPYDLREKTLKTYIDVWSSAMSECDRPIAAMNVGRRAANIYLRELIDERNS